DKIVENYNERVLLFFANLCCDPSHGLEIYDNVKDLLDSWFEVLKRKKHKKGISFWFTLISMLSTIPSIVPLLSPKYDDIVKYCEEEWHFFCSSKLCKQYISNISSFTSLCPEKDGYSHASHVCSIMELHQTVPNRKNKVRALYNIITGKEIRFQCIQIGDRLCVKEEDKHNPLLSHHLLAHSSLIKYTPPRHLLGRISVDNERSLRQSVYDMIERTGGGVEILFDQEPCCSFEQFDQEAWRQGMEDVVEEEKIEKKVIQKRWIHL
ncbi:hypothetical protein ADUPG1_000426, partial [Aduncisulcus paluster]